MVERWVTDWRRDTEGLTSYVTACALRQSCFFFFLLECAFVTGVQMLHDALHVHNAA
jgi:hypothetical protein